MMATTAAAVILAGNLYQALQSAVLHAPLLSSTKPSSCPWMMASVAIAPLSTRASSSNAWVCRTLGLLVQDDLTLSKTLSRIGLSQLLGHFDRFLTLITPTQCLLVKSSHDFTPQLLPNMAHMERDLTYGLCRSTQSAG